MCVCVCVQATGERMWDSVCVCVRAQVTGERMWDSVCVCASDRRANVG